MPNGEIANTDGAALSAEELRVLQLAEEGAVQGMEFDPQTSLVEAKQQTAAIGERLAKFRLPRSVITLSSEVAPAGSAGDIAIMNVNGTQYPTVL